MINFNDDVPHVPPRDWGFQQSSGEVWILQGGTTYESCSGQENSVSQTSATGKEAQIHSRAATRAWHHGLDVCAWQLGGRGCDLVPVPFLNMP
jgi:hypothetical protein